MSGCQKGDLTASSVTVINGVINDVKYYTVMPINWGRNFNSEAG